MCTFRCTLRHASNESCLQWWVNESIRDFVVPTFICGNGLQACTARCEGHRPKVLLWIMEEFIYISHELTDQDRDGRIVLSYELMMEAEHQYRVKWGGGTGCRCPLTSLGSTPPCSWDTLEGVAWREPDSKMLECLVWLIYDGVLSPGLTPKLTGPETYNQVTRRLSAKVFRGPQVHCPTRTSVHCLMNQSPVRKVHGLWSLRHPQVKLQEKLMLRRQPPWTGKAWKMRQGEETQRWMQTQTGIL